MKIKLGRLSHGGINPMPYDIVGCLHKSKWLDDTFLYFKSIHYSMNFNKRGYYQETPHTIKGRIKMKWMLIKVRLKGHYLNLSKRRVYIK